jgi:hypothetical protein
LDELIFEGAVVGGLGRFGREMEVPGRALLSDAPLDWPESLARGTLNFRVRELAAPLRDHRWSSIQRFDRQEFVAAFEIPQNAIRSNTLGPEPGAPEKGRAQLWRARLETEQGAASCWVLRRIGSGYTTVLELVSERRIREEIGLPIGTNWPARLRMYGSWR